VNLERGPWDRKRHKGKGGKRRDEEEGDTGKREEVPYGKFFFPTSSSAYLHSCACLV